MYPNDSSSLPATYLLAWAALVFLGACGGPNEATRPEAASSEKRGSGGSGDESSEDETIDAQDEPDPCAGGGCAPCGETVCLSGFFCDEAASACGWVPNCAESPNCECLEKELAGCSCSDRDGGLYVQCSSE